MDSYNTSLTTIQSDLDLVMGTTNRVPRLLTTDGFPEWKFRFKKYVKMKDNKVWRCFLRGPVKTTSILDDEAKTLVDKLTEDYTNDDFDKIEDDEKELAILTMALSPNITQGFREYKFAKDLWEALIEVYEGDVDMKQSRHDLHRQRFNMFNHILGEAL